MFILTFYIRLLLFSVYLLSVRILNCPPKCWKGEQNFPKAESQTAWKTEQTNIIQNCETFRAIEPEVDTY